jgi:hypothetical protein
MKKFITVTSILIAVSVFWLGFSTPFSSAAERSREAINKELTKSTGMPVLNGELWQRMTPDSKVAFLWGFWHSIAIDNYLSDKYPDLDRDDFPSKVMEATEKSPITINQTVTIIDEYYQENPAQLQKPVIAVFWDKVVRPNIKTGINGRPLKAKTD